MEKQAAGGYDQGWEDVVVDLGSFAGGDDINVHDPVATSETLRLIRGACSKHGFFQVINHGVDQELIADTHRHAQSFFGLPAEYKEKIRRKPGEPYGYRDDFVARKSSSSSGKETMSMRHWVSSPNMSTTTTTPKDTILTYFTDHLGEEFRSTGEVIQRYTEAMRLLALKIMELLGLSLGLDGNYYPEFFAESDSIMRFNYYTAKDASSDLKVGIDAHYDPISLTILHQNSVDGLEINVDGEWRLIRPKPHSFIVNLGDTFMALTNGRYKSVQHRAFVNSNVPRLTLAFFFSPDQEKVIAPPEELVDEDNPRMYPDYKWSKMLEFSQKVYRADTNTINAFLQWLSISSTPQIH